MSLLLDEQPLVILPKLAKKIGLNESIIVQQIHYWLEKNRQKQRNIHDGRVWCYNSYPDWQAGNFIFWSVKTVKRSFLSAEKKGYLITGNYNRAAYDRTKWYTISYETLGMANPLAQNGPMVGSEWADHGAKMGQPIPETNTEINPETPYMERATPNFTQEGIESMCKIEQCTEEEFKSKWKL